MGRQITSDFVLDTVGHCFICMDEISPQPPGSSSSTSIHSMLFLSRYLKIKMRKVFNEEVSIPELLLEKVEMSTLKVSLCEECASWNSRLSELLRKLEKIEIETASYLQLIHGKLKRAVQDEKNKIILSKLADSDRCSDSELMGKLEVAEALRKETMGKCSQKMNGAQLKVKLQKLSEKDIKNLKQPMFKGNYFETSIGINSEIGLNDVKLETSNSEGIWEEDPNDYLDHFEDSAQGNISSTMEHDSRSGSPEIRSTSSKYQEHYIRSSQTGKFECKLCEKTYASDGAFYKHYKHVHLKFMFKCRTCNKEFTQSSNLRIHEKSVHLKLRVNCQFCQKSFTTSGQVRRHLRLKKCKGMKTDSAYDSSKRKNYLRNPQTGKFECKLCAKACASSRTFYVHYQSIHLKRRFKCKICDKDFAQNFDLKTHQNNVHLKLRVNCQFCQKSFTTPSQRHRHIRLKKCEGMKADKTSSRPRLINNLIIDQDQLDGCIEREVKRERME